MPNQIFLQEDILRTNDVSTAREGNELLLPDLDEQSKASSSGSAFASKTPRSKWARSNEGIRLFSSEAEDGDSDIVADTSGLQADAELTTALPQDAAARSLGSTSDPAITASVSHWFINPEESDGVVFYDDTSDAAGETSTFVVEATSPMPSDAAGSPETPERSPSPEQRCGLS